jgi:hypothetical protein
MRVRVGGVDAPSPAWEAAQRAVSHAVMLCNSSLLSRISAIISLKGEWSCDTEISEFR